MPLLRMFPPDATPLVSIIIPAHEARNYIADTLASVARQTHPDWEVIVVEDGSQDDCEDIVRSFARRCRQHRVQYLRHERCQGVSAARNTALAAARGRYIGLLDADDRWLPNHLRASIDVLQAGSTDIAFSTAVLVEDGTDTPIGIWGPGPTDMLTFPQSLLGRCFIVPSTVVMRRDVFRLVAPFDTSLTHAEDFDFWLRCSGANMAFTHVGGIHCLYRKNHAGAATRMASKTVTAMARQGIKHLDSAVPVAARPQARKLLAMTFALAARLHASGDRHVDPSADPRQAAALAWQAWRLRPSRPRLLWLALWHGASARRRRAEAIPTGGLADRPRHEPRRRHAA